MLSNSVGSNPRAISPDLVNATSLAGKSNKSAFTAGLGKAYESVASVFAKAKFSIAVKMTPIYINLFIKDAGSFEKIAYFLNLHAKEKNLFDAIMTSDSKEKLLKEVSLQQTTEQAALEKAVDNTNTKNPSKTPYTKMLKNMAILIDNLAKYGTHPAALDKFLKNPNNQPLISQLCKTFGQDYVLGLIKKARNLAFDSTVSEKKDFAAKAQSLVKIYSGIADAIGGGVPINEEVKTALNALGESDKAMFSSFFAEMKSQTATEIDSAKLMTTAYEKELGEVGHTNDDYIYSSDKPDSSSINHLRTSLEEYRVKLQSAEIRKEMVENLRKLLAEK